MTLTPTLGPARLPAVLAAIQKPYDLVIPADDPTIGLIVGNDLALAIRNYFQSGTTLRHPVPLNADYPATMHMVYPNRMPVHQLLLNRHQSWKWFRKEGLGLMARKFALKLFAVLRTSRRVFPDRLLH